MIESRAEPSAGTWDPPGCPFVIEYAPRVLDEIRLAVIDAFFSLPRGGAEIGGILLGRKEEGRVRISDHRQLECEHAFGPSFRLSANDLQKLSAMLAEARTHSSGLEVVGWYHSHTRTEIELTDTDQEVHKRYFPQPWQVALVMKPHTFQPVRAGFFYREPDGSIHGAASRLEFAVEPIPMRSAGSPPPTPAATPPPPREREMPAPSLDVTAELARTRPAAPPPTPPMPPARPPADMRPSVVARVILEPQLKTTAATPPAQPLARPETKAPITPPAQPLPAAPVESRIASPPAAPTAGEVPFKLTLPETPAIRPEPKFTPKPAAKTPEPPPPPQPSIPKPAPPEDPKPAPKIAATHAPVESKPAPKVAGTQTPVESKPATRPAAPTAAPLPKLLPTVQPAPEPKPILKPVIPSAAAEPRPAAKPPETIAPVAPKPASVLPTAEPKPAPRPAAAIDPPAPPKPRPSVAAAATAAAPPAAPRPPAPAPAPPPSTKPAAASEHPPLQAPSFTAVSPKRSWGVLGTMLAIVVGLALGAAGFQSRSDWLPRAIATVRSVVPTPPPPYLGVHATEKDGQLQVRWDRNAPVVLSGIAGFIEINDGGQTQVVQLDRARLQSGALTYVRRSERVDIGLTVFQSGGKRFGEATIFMGRLPQPIAAPADPAPATKKDGDDLSRQVTKLRNALTTQTERARKAEKAADDAKQQLRQEQRRRLDNQNREK